MPYNAEQDQYFWLGQGYTQLPERDGTDFHPEYPSPSFFTAWFTLNEFVERKTLLDVVFVGKWYKGSDKITGIAGKIRMSFLQEIAAESPWNLRTSEEQAKKLIGASDDCEKLVGIYFRVLD